MTDTSITASIIPLHQVRPKTPAERAKAYRARKKAAATNSAPKLSRDKTEPKLSRPVTPTTPVMPPARVTPVIPSRPVTSIALVIAAFGLALTGITMNGWFARSLGSSDIAGWLFLAIGVAADLIALVVPSCAARHWQARRRSTAATAWAVFAATFLFAVMAGIGFASLNVADVTLQRASRVTPAVTMAQSSLSDAMTARDRECSGGVGKNCRLREEVVAERRQALDAALRSVEQAADPQTAAAVRIVTWISLGSLKPSGDDFAMLRLILLALLPQLGGVLLMVGRP
jgi:hypothetical protein